MALEFDGDDAYINVGNAASLDIAEGSLSLWFYTTDNNQDLGIFFNKDGAGSNAGDIQTGIDLNAAKKIGLKLTDAIGAEESFSDGVASINQWVYLVVTWGSGGGKMYVDAVLQTDVNSKTSGMTNTNIDAWIGYSSLYSFLGIIADLRIYNRNLSLAEIKAIYNSKGSDNIVNGLVGKWLMNEKAPGQTATVASSIKDMSGGANHGSPQNSPIYRGSELKIIRPQIVV